MTLIVLQRQHQHGDPINGHLLENIKLNVENLPTNVSVGNLYGLYGRRILN